MNSKINHYINLLKEYNETTNIYSKKAYDKLDFHIQDSIQLAKILTKTNAKIFDFGSGSGLPSVILAIKNPNQTIYAIESKSRKHKFLNHIKQKLFLENLHIIPENLYEWRPPCQADYITAKAFGSLEKIINISKKLNQSNSTIFCPISELQAKNEQASHQSTIKHYPPFYYRVYTNETKINN